MTGELYGQVFADGLLSSLIIPLQSQTAFFAMKAFGEYDASAMQTAALMAALGGTCGHMTSFALGLAVAKWSKVQTHPFWDKFAPHFRRYGVATLLFSWMSLFGFFSFAAGVFKTRWYIVAALLFAGQAFHYFSQL